jgi:lipoprotein NlpI
MDTQAMLDANGHEQTYVRTRQVASASAALQAVSQAEIYFNPAFQTVTLHEAAVLRNGVRHDRLKGARVELLRREEGLERQTLTGVQTLLVLLNDVRLSDVVEIAYTVHGSNPIYKGHFAELYQLAFIAPVDEMHLRIDAPATRRLQTRGIRSDATLEVTRQGPRQVLALSRRNVAAVVPEENTPPWYKVFPALHVSDYADWQQVAGWAVELFEHDGELGPELQARIEAWRAKGLPRDQLLGEVVEFVQDEVRYFSLSLGESSHRPKPPVRTYADRLGDCKDKVALLNAILRRLDYDVAPALISVRRNRGVADYLPSHDQFDHVVTRLVLDGNVYWIDATMQKQGRTLQTRGTVPYGMTLVVDRASTGLTRIEATPAQSQLVEWESVWDASDLKRHPKFTTTLRARGLAAEGWRVNVGSGGVERLASAVAGAYARALPGLKEAAPPVVRDDREQNVFELELQHEAVGFGQYDRGLLMVETAALELLDSLTGPREAQRTMPFVVDQPRQVRQRVRIIGPRKIGSAPPGPVEVADKHFKLSARYEISGNRVDYLLTYERRADDVQPADLATFRERLQAARKLAGMTVRLPLLDIDTLRPSLVDIERRTERKLGREADTLRDMVVRQEMERLLTSEVLKLAGEDGPLGPSLLERRAIANSSLADHPATLADAERAIAAGPKGGYSHYTRGLALMSLGRADEATAAMEQMVDPANRTTQLMGIGGSYYYRGQFAEAKRNFEQVLPDATGEQRVFALSWLFLASERAGRNGRMTVQPHLAEVSRSSWPGIVLHYLAGDATQDELLDLARKEKPMARLNLSEAYFYMGQRLLLSGKADDARRMFRRTLDLNATPYREYAYAEIELQRSGER